MSFPRSRRWLPRIPAHVMGVTALALLASFAAGCAGQGSQPSAIATLSYQVVNRFPHQPDAFTQGLLFHQGVLYESTGLYGRSSIRRVELETGKVETQKALEARFFGEGLARVGDRLIQITWREQTGLIRAIDTLEELARFRYRGEGWGLEFDGRHLILSDGSATLRFLDPATFIEVRTLDISVEGRPLQHINELELVDGQLFANILGSDKIARIDLTSGAVDGWLDLASLRGRGWRWRSAADLNGIAYDPATHRLFVTGKRWPELFELRLD
ncbi:MAG: glutaminyl-peptide cyclotransferase [Porticoccaceae bacterium]